MEQSFSIFAFIYSAAITAKILVYIILSLGSSKNYEHFFILITSLLYDKYTDHMEYNEDIFTSVLYIVCLIHSFNIFF